MRIALLVLAILGVSSPALAAAMASPPPPPPPPALTVVGLATVRDVRVVVACDDRSGDLPAAECAVDVSFSITADEEPVHLEVEDRGRGGYELLVDAQPVSGVHTLEAGQASHVSLHLASSLAARRVQEFQWIVPAMYVRHLVLGDVLAAHNEGAWFSTPALAGMRITVDGPVEVETTVPDFVNVSVGAEAVVGHASLDIPRPTIAIGITAPPIDHGPIQPGGPLLAAGVRFDMSNSSDDGRFLLRAGYEVGFAEHFFVSVAFETDFESIMESLVIEAATPAVLIIPSMFAGVGVVARQLGPRDADAALRLRVGTTLLVVGLYGDFDYWPAIGEWTMSATLQASI